MALYFIFLFQFIIYVHIIMFLLSKLNKTGNEAKKILKWEVKVYCILSTQMVGRSTSENS